MRLETNVQGLETIIEASIKDLGYEGLLVKSNNTLDFFNGSVVYGYENVNYPGIACLWVNPETVEINGLVNTTIEEEKEFVRVIQRLYTLPWRSQLDIDVETEQDVVQEAIYEHAKGHISDETMISLLREHEEIEMVDMNMELLDILGEIFDIYE